MRNLDCKKAQEWIVSDLDLTLDQDRRRRLDEHMATCQACRVAEIAYQDLWVSLARDTTEDPGEAFWNEYRVSLKEQLDQASDRRSRAWSLRTFTWKATAVVVPAMLALLLVFLGPGREAPRQPLVDNSSRHRLLQELNDVYGPTSEEIIPGAYLDRVTAELLHSKTVATTCSVPRWFEVEDEPSLPYL